MGIMSILSAKAQELGNGSASANDAFLILFTGESNSGGYAVNADATTYEKSARSSVQILNNFDFVFEDLHVTVNNLLDHDGLTANATHGWELGLANCVEDDYFEGKEQVYLVKAGQGGSLIAHWNTDGTYFTKLQTRYEAARDILIGEGKTVKPIIWYTHGINDAILGVPAVNWKAATITHIANLRTVMGANTPLLFAEIMSTSTGAAYNTAISEICSEVDNCYLIQCDDATLRDDHHWDYEGMKLLAQRMSTKTEELLNV